MSFSSFMSGLWDDVFAPVCANDSCSSGFADMDGSSSIDMSSSSSDDWTNCFGTQADFQPAAEAFNQFQGGGTLDAFDSSSLCNSSCSFNSFD